MSKFIKLKKEYKDFIKENANKIKKLNIDKDLTKEKCQSIYKLYNQIYKIIENSEKLNVNDVNHIILNYSKEDTDVELFRKFIKIKNLYLIKIIIKSNQWNNYISKLVVDLNLDKSDDKLEYVLSKGVYRLLMESVEQFRGCWEIADFTNNKIKKIEIIEPEHFDFLKKYLKTKL